jgi:DNA repair ATPase RecN
MASSILVNQLIVVGRRKNYTVNFNPGVNIIYGDSNTGKSTVVNLIDYLLGAKNFESYPEIDAAAIYAALDITLNDDRYTIKRDLFNPNELIEVYACPFEMVNEFPSKKYLPKFSKESTSSDSGFFSDFLLDALNLNNIKLKESPSKDDSKLVRLSFRDIFKYCYVDQDDLGDKRFFNSENWAVVSKNKEVFKYIFNALDSHISELQHQISEKTKKRNKLDKTYTTVSEFLRDSEFGSLVSLDAAVEDIDREIQNLNSSIFELSQRQVADSEVYNTIRAELEIITLERKALIQDMREQEQKIERFTRLKNDYLNDISKFKSTLSAANSIGEVKQQIEICPVCDNHLNVEQAKERFEVVPEDSISQEINALKRRARETEAIANETKRQWDLNKVKLNELELAENEAIKLQEKNTKELSSPYLAERDMYVAKLGELQQKRKDTLSRMKVRNQHNSLTKSIRSLDSNIAQLIVQLEELKKTTPSLSDVLSSLADNLKEYLSFVKIKSPVGISYNEQTFLPKVRDIDYARIPSGGLRTIVSIGYLCSMVQEALDRTMSYPSFLMIDTVGKYLGKTKEQKYEPSSTDRTADENEAVSDPKKYQNIFEYIIEISRMYEEKNRTCQFILVDNDVPDHIVDKLSGFIVAHFSSERINGLPVGFIDDAGIS